jgi:VanZ family protein
MHLRTRSFLVYWVPAIIMLALISVESTDSFSGAHTGHMLSVFLGMFSIHLPAEQLDLINGSLRKCGHVVGYGFLSFLLLRACRGTYRALAGYYDWRTSRVSSLPREHAFRFLWRFQWALLALAGTALTAIADEMHQKFIPSRGGSWWDVLLDSCAGLAAQVLIYWFAARNAQRAQARLETCSSPSAAHE